MAKSKHRLSLILMICLLAACSPNQGTSPISGGTDPDSAQPSPTAEPTDALVRIRVSTTSDWTELHVIPGKDWSEIELIQTSDEANASIDTYHLALDQEFSRAQSGESVELIAEATFPPGLSGESIVFIIRRGDMGATDVEISVPGEDDWVVIKKVRSDQITEGLNDHKFEISFEQLSGDQQPAAAPDSQWIEFAPVEPVLGLPAGTDGYPWWNDSIFYEIYVRSYYDSDGDGIGDLQGVIEKLDYLNDGNPQTTEDLGISGIWLMPIYPSPTNHGYNITDFKAVNPQLGTMEDLKLLLDQAHQRGIRVILDFMIGQTSNQHPWFLNSLNPNSSYRDWYIWSDTDPGYAGSWGQPVWHYVDGSYLYSTYSEWTPDLNMTNPAVKAEVFDAARFWLEEVGVDGFRLDSAKHVIEEGEIQANSESTHLFWKEFRSFYKAINPEAITVGEIWEHTSINAGYLQGDEFDLSFEFSFAYDAIKALNQENVDIMNDQVELSFTQIPPHQYATFLTNHDQDRLLDQVGNSLEKNKVAASLLLTAPGVPFIYYGEEIGLQGTGHDGARKPMQWSGDPNAGFSTATPWAEVGFGWEDIHVASQLNDPASLLSHYRSLIQARNQHAALRVGDPVIIQTNHPSLYSVLRISQNEAVLVLINLTGNSLEDYSLDLLSSGLEEGTKHLAPIIGDAAVGPLEVNQQGGFSGYAPISIIPPYATYILQVQD